MTCWGPWREAGQIPVFEHEHGADLPATLSQPPADPRVAWSARPRRAAVATACEFVGVDQRKHRLARHAHHYDHEPAPGVREIVGILIMDDIAARLPECLTRPNDPLRFTLHLEDYLALEYIAEHRTGVPMRA